MIITDSGIYAILDDSGFKEWRYLISGTECDGDLVRSQVLSAKPDYNMKTQKLNDQITINNESAIVSYDVIDLSPNEIESIRKPDPCGFLIKVFGGGDDGLEILFKKIIGISSQDLQVKFWYDQVVSASRSELFTQAGFNKAISIFVQVANLLPEEKTLVNQLLLEFDLEAI